MSETSKTKIEIKSYMGSILFTSEKETIKDALRDAVLSDAVLRGADLRGAVLSDADLSDADFFHAKFFGRGGSTKIKKSQVEDFFKALGIIVEE